MKMNSILVLATSLFASVAFAEQQQAPVVYQVPVARVQGNLACAISLGEKTLDCTLHVAGRGTHNIDMKAISNKEGAVVAHYGMDKVTEANSNYSLVIASDVDRAMKAASLFTETRANDGGGFSASMVSAPASGLPIVNVNPLNVDMSNPEMMNINIGFTVYAEPMASIAKAGNNQDLISFLMEKIQPYLLSLQK